MGHHWILYSVGVTGKNAYLVYHKHKFQHPYHQHGHGNSLRQVIRSIKSHAWRQLMGRPKRRDRNKFSYLNILKQNISD